MQTKTVVFLLAAALFWAGVWAYSELPRALQEFLPILGILLVIAFVVQRLPRIHVGHSDAFRVRRLQNWLPVGLLYAFLYFGRYNLTRAKGALGELMTNADFGTIFGVGTAVYGCAFLLNGPLTDRIGGKKAILLGAAGSAVANAAMGLVLVLKFDGNLRLVFSLLYGVNMYFQSFGAVAIVKINAPWFHVRERGVFGAIFGILISLGVYFAYDWGKLIVDNFATPVVFFVPSALLLIVAAVVLARAKNTPGEAGLADFHPGDSDGDGPEPRLGAIAVFKRMLTNPVIVTIACIEFCSGFLRQAIMQWYVIFADATATADGFVNAHWGMLLCCAGILGGVVAGTLSDHVFQSRRGPVAALLYLVLVVGSALLCFLLGSPLLGYAMVFLSMAVIGVHGMLSGTASMDFGGRRNAGIAVGIIDGFVYAGTAVMSFTYARILPDGEVARDPAAWIHWPTSMIPIALLGLVLALRLWNARPQKATVAK
jgi:OPA family glycerol-3-phosphate transporter-like MFS transporter